MPCKFQQNSKKMAYATRGLLTIVKMELTLINFLPMLATLRAHSYIFDKVEDFQIFIQ